jgi:CspA family cold shock protein
MATGTVKFFNAKKGYGFIEQDGGGPEVFVHYTATNASFRLEEGQAVTFDVAQGPKGPHAQNVTLQSRPDRAAERPAGSGGHTPPVDGAGFGC